MNPAHAEATTKPITAITEEILIEQEQAQIAFEAAIKHSTRARQLIAEVKDQIARSDPRTAVR